MELTDQERKIITELRRNSDMGIEYFYVIHKEPLGDIHLVNSFKLKPKPIHGIKPSVYNLMTALKEGANKNTLFLFSYDPELGLASVWSSSGVHP